MKKFLMISCLLFACMTIQAAELRSFTQPPENDVGYVSMTNTHDINVMYLNLEAVDFHWLGTISAEQDCIMPEHASIDAVVTADIEIKVRLAEFRWPNSVKSYILDSTLPNYNRARANLSAGDNIYFQVCSAA